MEGQESSFLSLRRRCVAVVGRGETALQPEFKCCFFPLGENTSALPKGPRIFLYALRCWNSDAAAVER